MLLTEKKAKLKWNGANKRKYVDLGYEFTKMKDEFLVNIEHITPTTRAIISMKCDYCGKEREQCYKQYTHILQRSETKKDTCGENDCIRNKMAESSISIYGTESPNQSESVKQKKIESIQKNYGQQYVSATQIPEIRSLIAQTNIEKFGAENVFASEYGINKIKETNLMKYGHEYYHQTDEYKILYGKENSPVWNPLLTDEERISRRNYLEYNNWRKDVFERDDYTCQCCKESASGKINAHHKDGYHWCEDRRTDIDNGVTLCEDCHLEFHAIYGRRNNTEDQYIEFHANKTFNERSA